MALKLHTPITYLITSGATTRATRPSSAEFLSILASVEASVAAGIALVQLREKELTARMLYELAARAAALARGSATRLLVNDRADVARAAGCDGVHLSARSLEPRVVRRAFGGDSLIRVSAHTLGEVRAARDGAADFATFGPVFDTPSKRAYGPPVGLEALGAAAGALAGFPLVALGGVSEGNVAEVLASGAGGVAAIRMFADEQRLARALRLIGVG